MASISIAGRRVGQEIPTGAGHLALFYTDDAGAEFVLSAYTDNTLLSGDLFIETFEGSAWVPRVFSTESTLNPDIFATVPLAFGAQDPEGVADLIDQFALAINTQNFDYEVFTQNSNSTIGTLLELVGINVDGFIPNPPDVGFLGFVAKDNRLEFSYRIDGTAEGDILQGRSGAQEFSGNAGDDTLSGGSGDDTLAGNQGDDSLNGGDGVDKAVFVGTQKSYTLTLSPTATVLSDRTAGGDGTDTLIDIEDLQFSGAPSTTAFDLTFYERLTGLSETDLKSVIELYIAYFNRAPDAEGLYFWGVAFGNGYTLDQIAASFVDQDETRMIYPEDTTNRDFVEAVYGNVLGRVPDTGGADFWVGLLDTDVLQRDTFILRLLQGAKAELKPELGQDFVDQQVADQAFLETKTDIGAYFAVHKGMSDVADATDAMVLFDGTVEGTNLAVAAIDDFYAQALDPVEGAFLMPLVGVLDDLFAVA